MAPKRIPKSVILKHFINLPKDQRDDLLKKHLSSDLIRSQAANEFYQPMHHLVEKPKEEAMAFLEKLFGDSPEHLKKTVAHGEDISHGFHVGDYTKTKAHTDLEKMYALVCSDTLAQRLRIFYDDLNDKDKQPYIRSVFDNLTKKEKVLADHMSNPTNFAPGKNPEAFLEDVKKTMDLSKEKSMMEHLREGAPDGDPERRAKLQWAAQQYMVFEEGSLDPSVLVKKMQNGDWKKNPNMQNVMQKENSGMRLSMPKLMKRIRSAVSEFPETEEEKTIFREAALQACRDYRSTQIIFGEGDNSEEKEFVKFCKEMETDVAADALKQEAAQDIRKDLAKEYGTLEKEKSGWFLSKTNTEEYNEMMKHLRLFNAKLDMISGKKPKEGLTEEELETVKKTGADVLLANAKQGCYHYGALKTKSGTGSIWHDAGTDRFNASMKTLSKLGELGKTLHLSDSATCVRDEAQLQVLQNRRNGDWLKTNLEDAVAKTICAQVLLNKKTADYLQRGQLEGDALNAQVEKIKSHGAFRKMMDSTSPEKLADAVIKGGSALYDAYNKAAKAATAEGRQRSASEIEPDSLKPERDGGGLVPGSR